MKMINKPLFGLLACALTASLTACAPKCPPSMAASPPVVYLQQIPEPKLKGQTNADLLNWALDLRAALRLANADKEALRQWAQGGSKGKSYKNQAAEWP